MKAMNQWMTSFEVIEELEADLKIPVVTANQATIWSLARRGSILKLKR